MYIRFKDIPNNELSGVYDGDLGKIREEIGVSCYKAIKFNNTYKIILPSLTEGCLYDLLGFIRDCRNDEIPVYLIDGQQVGDGSYGEPLLKHIRVLKKLKIIELAEPKPEYKMDKTNCQFQVL